MDSKSASAAQHWKAVMKKQNLKQLGEEAKHIGLVQNMDHGDIFGIQFVKPTDKKSKFVSKSSDYTVIMHFSNYIRQKIMERGVTPEGIEQAFQDFQFHAFKQKNAL